MLLVPMVSKTLRLVEDKVSFNVFGASITVDLHLPFSWAAFYFASLSFTFALLLFAWKCPTLIKLYEDFADFISSENHLKRLPKYINEVTNEMSDNIFVSRYISFGNEYSSGTEEDNILGYIGSKSEPKRFQIAVTKTSEPTAYGDVIELIETERLNVLRTVAALYFLGYALMLVVLIQNLIFVVRTLF